MQKGFGLIGILIVVGIIAIASIGAFKTGVWERNPFMPSEEEKSAIDMAEQVKNVLEQKNNNNETADWKTYRNEEYGFEFKYPPTWKLEEIKLDVPQQLRDRGVYEIRLTNIDDGSMVAWDREERIDSIGIMIAENLLIDILNEDEYRQAIQNSDIHEDDVQTKDFKGKWVSWLHEANEEYIPDEIVVFLDVNPYLLSITFDPSKWVGTDEEKSKEISSDLFLDSFIGSFGRFSANNL